MIVHVSTPNLYSSVLFLEICSMDVVHLKLMQAHKQVEPQPQQAPEEAEVEGCEEGADDDDEARSEATFRFRVEGFSTIKDSTLSESCVIRWVTFSLLHIPL